MDDASHAEVPSFFRYGSALARMVMFLLGHGISKYGRRCIVYGLIYSLDLAGEWLWEEEYHTVVAEAEARERRTMGLAREQGRGYGFENHGGGPTGGAAARARARADERSRAWARGAGRRGDGPRGDERSRSRGGPRRNR